MKTLFNLYKIILFAAFLMLAAGSQAQTVTYLWSNGAVTPNIVVNPQQTTTYYLTITQDGVEYFDSLVVTVTPPPVVAINGNSTVCLGLSTTLQATQGNSYLWSTGDTTASITVSPSENTSYSVEITDAAGCTGTAEINVIVNQPSTTTETASACGSYTWNGTTYNQSGTYNWSGTNTAGCDSVVTLNLTINQPSAETINATITEGESYSFDGQNLTTAGTYSATLQNAAGCDSVVTLNLTVEPVVEPLNCEINSSANQLCLGESLFLTINPANSVETFNLESFLAINPELQLVTSIGQSNYFVLNTPLTWNDAKAYGDSKGLNLFVINNPSEESLVYNSLPFKGNDFISYWIGLYQDPNDIEFSEPAGGWKWVDGSPFNYQNWFPSEPNNNVCCPAEENCGLIEFASYGKLWNDLFCGLQNLAIFETRLPSILWSTGETTPSISVSPAETTTYSVTVTQGTQTCTSEVTIAVNQAGASTVNATITEGESYSFNGQNLTNAGTYTANLQNAAGCDSVVTLNLVVEPNVEPLNCAIQTTASVTCSNESTTLSVNPPNIQLSPLAVANPLFSGYGQWNYSPGNPVISCYSWTYGLPGMLVFGDSTAQLGYVEAQIRLTWGSYFNAGVAMGVNRNSYNDGQPFNGPGCYFLAMGGGGDLSLFNGTGNTPSGFYPGAIASVMIPGFDVNANNTIRMEILSGGLIQGYVNGNLLLSYQIPGGLVPAGRFALVTSNAQYEFQGISAAGGNGGILWSTGETSASISVSPTETTTYNVTVNQGSQTCTSEVTITVNQPSTASETVSACNAYIWNGTTYTQSGTYTWTGTNAAGCDSVVTLNLTITPQPEQPQLACWQTATFDAASCSWVISGTQPAQPTDLACFETALFVDTLCAWVVTGTPTPAIVTNASACVSYTWEANGTTYNTSGQYSFNSNCQEYVLNLTIDGQPEQPQLSCWQTAAFDAASCSWVIGGTQPAQPTDLACWETAIFNTALCAWEVSGTQPEQPTNLACYETALFVDTLCNWVVTGTPSPAIVTNASACVGYTWEANGATYNTSGQYSFNSNCQEFVLNLTINQESASTINATITEGESYSFDGQILTTSGTYSATLQNAAGCDSVVTLNLTVEPAIEPLNCEITASDAQICLGEIANLSVPFTPSSGNVLDTIFNRYSAFEYSFQATGSWKTEIGGWQTGNAPFGNTTGGEVDNNAPEFAYNTFWPTGSTLFVRKSFNLDGFSPEGVRWKLGVDNGYNLFVNGNFISGIYEDGFTSTWEYEGLIPAQYLNSGDNIIALELTDGGFLTAFDMMLEGNRNQTETSILWSTGETTPSISVSPTETTTYSVTVTQGGQSCTSEVTITVNQPSAETVNATITEGETYSFNGQNLTTAGTYTSTLQNAAGCDSLVTLNLTVNPVPVDGCYAATVVNFSQGQRADAANVAAIRSNPEQALGMPEPVVTNVVNFVSLGFGGSITLAFEAPIANGNGADIRIDEATWGNNPCDRYPESADVFASQDGSNFIYLGRVCQDAELDLGPLSWAQYVRIVDASDLLSFNADADGYDVNGISCLNGAATSLNNDGLVACSLQEVVSYQPGTRKNGTAVGAPRNNATNALGMPQNNNTINFVALGFGGVLEAKFDYVVFNQPGNELRVTETSFGNPSCTNYPEKARVSVSLDGNTWTELGEICQDGELDLGTLPYAQYIRIQDASPMSSNKFNGSADGFDVDAVVVLNNGCGMNSARLAALDNTQTADEEISFSLYPNPMEDYTILRWEGLDADAAFRLELFDAAGRIVRGADIEVRGNEYLFRAADLAPGVYQVVISNEQHRFSARLLK